MPKSHFSGFRYEYKCPECGAFIESADLRTYNMKVKMHGRVHHGFVFGKIDLNAFPVESTHTMLLLPKKDYCRVKSRITNPNPIICIE